MEINLSIHIKLEEMSFIIQETFCIISDIVEFMTRHLWCIAIAPKNGSAMEEETLREGRNFFFKCHTSY